MPCCWCGVCLRCAAERCDELSAMGAGGLLGLAGSAGSVHLFLSGAARAPSSGVRRPTRRRAPISTIVGIWIVGCVIGLVRLAEARAAVFAFADCRVRFRVHIQLCFHCGLEAKQEKPRLSRCSVI